ncbi:hypothetical protein KBD87_02195 [Candidatus Saccharibacteria bacterium]|nr:hypothetical protein [Candidatus Saccharibacteria bacterium]
MSQPSYAKVKSIVLTALGIGSAMTAASLGLEYIPYWILAGFTPNSPLNALLLIAFVALSTLCFVAVHKITTTSSTPTIS